MFMNLISIIMVMSIFSHNITWNYDQCNSHGSLGNIFVTGSGKKAHNCKKRLSAGFEFNFSIISEELPVNAHSKRVLKVFLKS